MVFETNEVVALAHVPAVVSRYTRVPAVIVEPAVTGIQKTLKFNGVPIPQIGRAHV